MHISFHTPCQSSTPAVGRLRKPSPQRSHEPGVNQALSFTMVGTRPCTTARTFRSFPSCCLFFGRFSCWSQSPPSNALQCQCRHLPGEVPQPLPAFQAPPPHLERWAHNLFTPRTFSAFSWVRSFKRLHRPQVTTSNLRKSGLKTQGDSQS